MSIQVVIDSSVAYKWHYRNDEPGVEIADALLADHVAGDIVLVAPTTLTVEIANALRYSGLPPQRVSEIIDLIGATQIHLFHPSTGTLLRAADLAFEHEMSVYDALFLELAQQLRCPLYTSDRKAFGGIETPVEIRLV